jgi:hypothetical protein
MNEFLPAARVVHAQTWWMASELARRNQKVLVRHTFPFDFYTGLELREAGSPDFVFLNFGGAIHLLHHGQQVRISASVALEAQSPHAVIQRIEQVMGWRGKASATTAKLLTYRVIAALLALKQNARLPHTVTAMESWGRGDFPAEYAVFPSANTEAVNSLDEAAVPVGMWVLRAGGTAIAVFSDRARLYVPKQLKHDFMSVYRESGRNLDAVISDVLARISSVAMNFSSNT